MESLQRVSIKKDEAQQTKNQGSSMTSIWTTEVLKLVDIVLRPPEGGPPSFPEHGDAVILIIIVSSLCFSFSFSISFVLMNSNVFCDHNFSDIY